MYGMVVIVINGNGFYFLYISDLNVVNEQKMNLSSRWRSKRSRKSTEHSLLPSGALIHSCCSTSIADSPNRFYPQTHPIYSVE